MIGEVVGRAYDYVGDLLCPVHTRLIHHGIWTGDPWHCQDYVSRLPWPWASFPDATPTRGLMLPWRNHWPDALAGALASAIMVASLALYLWPWGPVGWRQDVRS